MALEGSADVDEESVVVDEFATDDEWSVRGHASEVDAVVAAVFRAGEKALQLV